MSEETTLQPRFLGKQGAMFALALKTGLLTLITLGIYRFWAKTRIRRYIWSSIQIGDDVAEYTGTGLEKLLGFLVAVVILAVYLGIVNIVLMFFGYNLIGMFSDPGNMTEIELVISILITYVVFLSLIPLLFFAQYRSHRYMLSRTRWRGMRMALSPGAWGFAWRAVLYSLLTGMTMGITLPLQTLQLQKYITDRQWFGNAQFSLEGEWTELFHAMKHLLFAILALIGAFIIMAFSEILGVVAIFIAYFWIFFGFLYFNIKAYIYLMDRTKLDGVIGFKTSISVGSILGTYIVGILIVIGISIVAILGLSLLIAAYESVSSTGGELYVLIGLMALAYVLTLSVISAAATAFVAMPVLGKFVTGTHIVNAEHLDTIQQREGDDIPDADGFADALDVGGAF